MIYLSPTPSIKNPVGQPAYGRLLTYHSGVYKPRPDVHCWALDNGCFGMVDGEITMNPHWSPSRWLNNLRRQIPYRDNCLFACVPDYPSDRHFTLTLFKELRFSVSDLGFTPALVIQDGVTLNDVRYCWYKVGWDRSCRMAVFVGGTNYYKSSPEAFKIYDFCINHDIWLHIGRVNSTGKMLKYGFASSCDGTTLARKCDEENQNRFRRGMTITRSMKNQQRNRPYLTPHLPILDTPSQKRGRAERKRVRGYINEIHQMERGKPYAPYPNWNNIPKWWELNI